MKARKACNLNGVAWEVKVCPKCGSAWEVKAMKAMKTMKVANLKPIVIKKPAAKGKKAPSMDRPVQAARKALHKDTKTVPHKWRHPWIAAVQAARKALHIKGFGSLKKGSPLYVKAKALYLKT